MGLLKHVLFWPWTGPSFLTRFSLEKAEEAARQELTDDEVVKEDLMALQMQFELGEVDEEEYVEREAALMQRLRDVRYWREQFGMATSGGPVQVSREDVGDETPSVAEEVVASPEGTDDRTEAEAEEQEERRGGIASSQGAEVEINLDWE